MAIPEVYKEINPFLSGYEFRNGVLRVINVATVLSGTKYVIDTAAHPDLVDSTKGLVAGFLYSFSFPKNEAATGGLDLSNLVFNTDTDSYSTVEMAFSIESEVPSSNISFPAGWASIDETDDNYPTKDNTCYRYVVRTEDIGGVKKTLKNRAYSYIIDASKNQTVRPL